MTTTNEIKIATETAKATRLFYTAAKKVANQIIALRLDSDGVSENTIYRALNALEDRCNKAELISDTSAHRVLLHVVQALRSEVDGAIAAGAIVRDAKRASECKRLSAEIREINNRTPR